MDSVVNFSDTKSCKKVDALCPVLSSALKGAMGGRDRQPDGETPADHATRSLCYGAIFKARLVFYFELGARLFILFCRLWELKISKRRVRIM